MIEVCRKLVTKTDNGYTTMIKINGQIFLQDNEIKFNFIRSSGPGGQNVNKVATAVQLRFDVVHSPSLPQEVRERLMKIAKNQLNKSGEIVMTGKRYRTQERNRQDVIKRLVTLIQCATHVPKPRKKRKLPKSVDEKRLAEKKHRSMIKKLRKNIE